MTSYQQQAEQEMWDAAASVEPSTPVYTYHVYVTDTGARCLSTNDRTEAITRARQVDGTVRNRFEQTVWPAPDPGYDPRSNYPERYTDGRPI